jgi:hypothetical protein
MMVVSCCLPVFLGFWDFLQTSCCKNSCCCTAAVPGVRQVTWHVDKEKKRGKTNNKGMQYRVLHKSRDIPEVVVQGVPKVPCVPKVRRHSTGWLTSGPMVHDLWGLLGHPVLPVWRIWEKNGKTHDGSLVRSGSFLGFSKSVSQSIQSVDSVSRDSFGEFWKKSQVPGDWMGWLNEWLKWEVWSECGTFTVPKIETHHVESVGSGRECWFNTLVSRLYYGIILLLLLIWPYSERQTRVASGKNGQTGAPYQHLVFCLLLLLLLLLSVTVICYYYYYHYLLLSDNNS